MARGSLTGLSFAVVCADPRLHTVQVAIANDKYEILRPEGVFSGDMRGSSAVETPDSLFRYFASARTVETPLKFSVPSPSPVLLSHEALMTIASVPEARGACSTPYAFVPLIA